jgi:ATP-dependent DNA helicase RecG
VRLINKFPEPPNKDVGEGLNTAFDAMRRLNLKEPIVAERDNSVM